MLGIRQLIRASVVALAGLALAACGDVTITEEAAIDAPAGVDVVGAQDLPYCPEIQRPATAEECAYFTRLAEGATAGSAAFNAPNPMKRGDTHELQLAISLAPPPPPPAPEPEPPVTAPEPTTPEITEGTEPGSEEPAAPGEPPATADPDTPPDTATAPEPAEPPTPGEVVDSLPGETEEYSPLVGRFMRAELSGVGFEITPLSPAQQEVVPDGVTTWTWRVVAREAGVRSLTLTTVVEGCNAEGECFPLRRTVRNHPIEVEVTTLGRIWDFLTAAPDWLKLLAAVLGGLAAVVTAFFGLRAAFKGKDSTPAS